MIAVFDNFIQDESLLKEIEHNFDSIFGDRGVYKWYDGWWNSPANNTTKKIIEYAWGVGCPIMETFSIEGFEYWTGIQSSSDIEDGAKNYLNIHFDKDEALHKETGEVVTPTMGSVYYPLGQSFRGGDLAIYTEEGENPELIKAKPNRFVIFNAGQYPHEVTPVIDGVRHAIAINLWEKEPYSKRVGDLVVE